MRYQREPGYTATGYEIALEKYVLRAVLPAVLAFYKDIGLLVDKGNPIARSDMLSAIQDALSELLDLAPAPAKHKYFRNLNEIFDVESLFRFYANHQVTLARRDQEPS